MKIFIVIFGIFLTFFVQNFSAHAAPVCPDFTKISLSADDVVGKIQECMQARANGNPASITDFQCPAGDYAWEDKRALTEDRIAYHIATNIFFNESDKLVKTYMQELHKIRDKNAVAWNSAYNSCIVGTDGNSQKSLKNFYENVCSFSFVFDFLNSNSSGKKFGTISYAFPQEMCQNLAQKKKNAWLHLGEMMMVNGIYKSYENDRNSFVEGVTGQYRSILEKFHNYQKIIFRASSKITHYIREAVK